MPCARELGVGIVAYSPLCRGLLTGSVDPSALPATDSRIFNPRFTADNFSANMAACVAPLASTSGALLFSLGACAVLHASLARTDAAQRPKAAHLHSCVSPGFMRKAKMYSRFLALNQFPDFLRQARSLPSKLIRPRAPCSLACNQNVAAMDISLSDEDEKQLRCDIGVLQGNRYPPERLGSTFNARL